MSETTVDAQVSPAMRREGERLDSVLYATRTGAAGTITLLPTSAVRGRFSRLLVTRGADGRVAKVEMDEVSGRRVTLLANWQAGSLAHVTLQADGPGTRAIRAELGTAQIAEPAVASAPFSAMKAQDSCLGAIGAYDLSVVLYVSAVAELAAAPENPAAWGTALIATYDVDSTYATMNRECGF